MQTSLERTIAFLNQIGIKTILTETAGGFLEHVRIVAGDLHVMPEATPSNVLHEAGHVAIVPSPYRQLMDNDVDLGVHEMFEQAKAKGIEVTQEQWQQLIQVSESEATAWAWAAGKAIGLEDEEIIEDHDYEGDGATERVRLSLNSHYGINGLQHAGFCRVRASSPGVGKVYPELNFWLQH
ncbi:hypothetical protein ACYPKM_01605 [Pseudomonas aeruginosa]